MAVGYFIPPTAALRPFRALPPERQEWSLWRHYRPADAGLNLWLLDDGSIVTEQPWQDEGVVRTFHGGHVHAVDEVEAAALIAAGYELSAYSPPAPSVPLPDADPIPWNPTPTYGFGTYGAGGYGEGYYGGEPDFGLHPTGTTPAEFSSEFDTSDFA